MLNCLQSSIDLFIFFFSSIDLKYLDFIVASVSSVLQTQVQGLWKRKQPPPERAEGNKVFSGKSQF